MPLDGTTYETELTGWLIEGRERLVRFGWHPGPGGCGDFGSVCMLLALPVWGRRPEDARRAHDALLAAIKDLGHQRPMDVSDWNDAPGRTLGEVLAVYDLAIEMSRS